MPGIFFAPMEGITGCIYRNAHQKVFGSADRYYTPFIYANPSGRPGRGDRHEIDPAVNHPDRIVPQLLSNEAEDFIRSARYLADLGYREINLNLGCPSMTVSSKGRGSGFLREPERLDHFLETVFEDNRVKDIGISLKTRIGYDDAGVFPELLRIYGKYPIKRLIIHPRLRTDFYGGDPRYDAYDLAEASERSYKLCYNGDICNKADYERMLARYPRTDDFMIGRGLLANPALYREIVSGQPLKREELLAFQERLRQGYEERMVGKEGKVLFLLKEQWRFWRHVMSEEDDAEIEVLLHTSDPQAFYRKAEEILTYAQILPGKGFSKIAPQSRYGF